jgi:hypothetical protein
MLPASKFDSIWNDREQLAEVAPAPESVFCRPARALHAYAAELIAPLAAQKQPAGEKLWLAMLRLQRKYFRLLETAPKAHQDPRSRRRHVCLHAVYEDAYRTLEAMLEGAEEIRLSRPPARAAAAAPALPAEPPPKKTVADALIALYEAF